MTIFCAVSFLHPHKPYRLDTVACRVVVPAHGVAEESEVRRASYQGMALAMPKPAKPDAPLGLGSAFAWPTILGNAFQRGREGIERERSQQVAAQPALDFAETFRRALHPGEVGGFRHFLEFAQNVCVAYQLRRARLQEHQVFEQ